MSINHTLEGRKYLEKGLELAKVGEVDNAIESFFLAATEFEKAQDFRQIPAVWEAIGNLLEPSFVANRQLISSYWFEWPLDYRVILLDKWKSQTDSFHKQSWAYQWAAEHREKAGDSITAYRLFFKAAKKAEQTENGRNYPEWPAKLYCSAALNFIRSYRTIDHAIDRRSIEKQSLDRDLIKEGIKKMENYYKAIKDRSRSCSSLAISYKLLKASLVEVGNLTEAEQFKRKERSTLTHYYICHNKFLHALAEWLAGRGFIYFIILFFIMISFVFPFIYYKWELAIPVQGKFDYFDAVFYSIESALGIDHNEFYVGTGGKLLNIIEATLSWLGLGVFIWWLTRRLE